MRLTRSKTRKQEEALLERAMNSQPSGPSDAKDSERVLWVLINDFTDSDNHAAALVWAKFLTKHHGMKGIYIAEPRHVDLGYYTTSREFGECIALVRDLEPRLEGADQPMKAVLAGNLKLTEDDINNSTYKGRELTENERKLVSLEPPATTCPCLCPSLRQVDSLTVPSCNGVSSQTKPNRSWMLPKEMQSDMQSSL